MVNELSLKIDRKRIYAWTLLGHSCGANDENRIPITGKVSRPAQPHEGLVINAKGPRKPAGKGSVKV
jgi:hypothetical protein